MPKPAPPRVALLIESSNSYARGLLRGIEDYIRAYGPWSVFLAEHGRGDRVPPWLSSWKGDGIIARIENRVIARALEPLELPIVDVSAAMLLPELPCVETDDSAIAALAASHFIDRGFQHFAFCGVPDFNWSNWREENFAHILKERGFECTRYDRPPDCPDGEPEVDAIGEWLARLPKPVAVFACYDARGQQVLDACRRRDLEVPDEVAVLGVDNDDVLCELSPPPLSSIIPNARRTGWEAAALLARMIAGEKVPPGLYPIPPLGIASRQSTDITAVEDACVARAARFIRENACSGISVADVVAAVPLARRLLEKRFRAMLGHTLREELTRVQMQRAKELLSGTDLPLAEIAGRVGFKHVEYLTVVFKRECGMAPSAYRQSQRPQDKRAATRGA
jgi:LacI family transcriptional regulator